MTDRVRINRRNKGADDNAFIEKLVDDKVTAYMNGLTGHCNPIDEIGRHEVRIRTIEKTLEAMHSLVMVLASTEGSTKSRLDSLADALLESLGIIDCDNPDAAFDAVMDRGAYSIGGYPDVSGMGQLPDIFQRPESREFEEDIDEGFIASAYVNTGSNTVFTVSVQNDWLQDQTTSDVVSAVVNEISTNVMAYMSRRSSTLLDDEFTDEGDDIINNIVDDMDRRERNGGQDT